MHKNKEKRIIRTIFKKAARSMKMKRAIQMRRIVSRAVYPEYCCCCGKLLDFSRKNPAGDKFIPFLCEGKDNEAHELAYMLYRAFSVPAVSTDEEGRKWGGLYDMVCPECVSKELLRMLGHQEGVDGTIA